MNDSSKDRLEALVGSLGLLNSDLRPGMRCLLTILDGRSLDRRVEDAEWESALTLASKERVLPWLLARLSENSSVLSARIQTLFVEARRENAIEAFFWSNALKGLLKAFHEHDVPVIPLKGPALAERIYGGIKMRTCQDLDLLVYSHDFARAQNLLGQLGFTPKTMIGYQQGWVRGAMMVELHCDVSDPEMFDFHIDGAWREAYPTTFEGIPTWQLAPEDEYLFLCLHAVRHEFNRLSVVLDIALATHLLAQSTRRHFRLEIRSLRRHCELGYLISGQLLPQLCLQLSLLEDHRVSRALAPVLVDRIRNVLTKVDTPLSWAARQHLHAQLESSPWRRLQRRVIDLGRMVRHGLTGELAERDRAFAARWGLKHPWQARVLRPIRLARNARDQGTKSPDSQ